jgi:hypothetical protein
LPQRSNANVQGKSFICKLLQNGKFGRKSFLKICISHKDAESSASQNVP